MPLADGKITLRIDDNEAQVLFWALVDRVGTLSEKRRIGVSLNEDVSVLETEIVQVGSLLEKLPTYKYSRGENSG